MSQLPTPTPNVQATLLAVEGIYKQHEHLHPSAPLAVPFTVAEWGVILEALRGLGASETHPISATALDSRRLDWLDQHCAFVADSEYKIGPFAVGELRQLADAGLAADWVAGRIAAAPVQPSDKRTPFSAFLKEHLWRMYQEGQISADHTAREVFDQMLDSLAEWLTQQPSTATSATHAGVGLSVHEADIICAAVQLAPLLEQGWDDQDTPEDQNEGAKACDALVAAVNRMLGRADSGANRG